MLIISMQWTYVAFGAVVVAVLMGLFLVPALIKINRTGKKELGPMRVPTARGTVLGPDTPPGAGDNKPGTVNDPAPGMPDGQADPWMDNPSTVRRHAASHSMRVQ